MATSKTLAPTNVTISIPAMTDAPDASVFSNCVDKEADAINALNSQLGNSSISQHDVSDLNSAIPSGAGVYFFTYPNTASNRPATAGGMGLTFGNGSYGVQISAANRGSDGNTLYYRNFWDSGNSFGSWRLVTSTT